MPGLVLALAVGAVPHAHAVQPVGPGSATAPATALGSAPGSAPGSALAAVRGVPRNVCAPAGGRTKRAIATSGRSGSRPNILLVTVDDATLSDLVHMPRLQRGLVAQGTSASNGFAPTPLCAPARASLLTGRLAHNHGTRSIEGRAGGVGSFKDRDTLPRWLQKSGYRTGFVGKYLNGYGTAGRSGRYVPPGWDRWRASIDRTTYNFSRTSLSRNGRVATHRGYNTCTFAREADRFIRDGAGSKRPWFLWANYVAPHHGGPGDSDDPTPEVDPVRHREVRRFNTTTPHPAHRDLMAGVPLSRGGNRFESDTRDKVVPSTRVPWPEASKVKLQEVQAQRLESLQAVDEVVARHLALLKRTGQLRRTVVVFTSDNGYLLGEHNMLGKVWHYRGSTTVPMVFRGPGIRAGARTSTIISNADIPVTLAGFARAKVRSSRVDGRDLRSVLAGGSAPVRAVPMAAWPVRGGGRALYTGVRVGKRWSYARLPGGEELYDWSRDPDELTNVARRPSHRRILAELRTLDRRLRTCHGTGESRRSCDSAALTARAVRVNRMQPTG